MWRTLLLKIIDVSKGPPPNLAWSLQPLLNTMLFFSIDLNVSRDRSPLKRLIISVLCLTSFAFMAFSNVYFNFILNSTSGADLRLVQDWITVSTLYKWRVWNIIFPSSMFYASAFKWRQLWKKAQKVQESMNYPATFLWQLRVTSTTMVVVIICGVNALKFKFFKIKKKNNNNKCQSILQEVSWYTFRGTYKKVMKLILNGDWLQALSRIGLNLLDMHECLTVALFGCLTKLASMSIQLIIEEVKNPFLPVDYLTRSQLLKWKRSFYLIMKFIRKIDDYFSMFLFIFFTNQFLTFFLDSCNAFGQYSLIKSLHYICRDLFLMFWIIYTVRNMEKQVI